METDFLRQALILLGAIVLVVPLMQRAGAGAVAGYLLAGLLIGPPVLGWVREHELIGSVAEFGVVFLLFSIGIELRPARLWLMRRLVFGLGTAQLLACGAAIAALLYLAGFGLAGAVVCGLALALSSTAIVVQLLSERRELASQRGRASFAVLLLQDVAVAPLITLVYVLGHGGGSERSTLLALLQALGALAAVLVLGRLAWRHGLPAMAAQRNADTLVAVALLLVLGAAWIMEHAGTSLALGAFLAGVLLADSPFRHQVVADIQPFRGILLGLFFMSVGMSIDRAAVLGHAPLLFAVTAALMALKSLLVALLLRAFGLPAGEAVKGALLLSQAGEFALILFGLAASEGLVDARQEQLLYQVAVLSMLLTPVADRLGTLLATLLPKRADAGDALHAGEHDARHGHVLICGYGRVGQQISRLLAAADTPWLAVDVDSAAIEAARAAGLPVYFGDCGRSEILRALDAGHAALVLITLDDPGAAERTLLALRQLAPETRVIARASDHDQARLLRAHGVLRAVPETTEYSLQLGLALLAELGLDAERRLELEDTFRDDEYARLLGRGQTARD